MNRLLSESVAVSRRPRRVRTLEVNRRRSRLPLRRRPTVTRRRRSRRRPGSGSAA